MCMNIQVDDMLTVLHLDESQSVSQVPVEAMTFLCSLQLILTLPRHRLQVLPACTANMSK